MSIYVNGYDRKSTMEQIKRKNHGYKSSYLGSCTYRNDDGNCCLVGVFIPDEKYDDRMENECADEIINEYDLFDFMPLKVYYMQKLQIFHDETLDNKTGKDFYQAIENYLIEMEERNG